MSDPSEQDCLQGEEQREVSGRSIKPGVGGSCSRGSPGRVGGARQPLGRGTRMFPISPCLISRIFYGLPAQMEECQSSTCHFNTI